MDRYSRITNKNQREIVLLKAKPVPGENVGFAIILMIIRGIFRRWFA